MDAASLDDDGFLALATAMVTTTDAVKAAFAARVALPVVVNLINVYRVGGLSPAGHLVGTTTCYIQRYGDRRDRGRYVDDDSDYDGYY